MDSKELRIGNWVKYKDAFTRIEDGVDIDASEAYSPIKISEEWLLSFGFIDYRTLPHRSTKKAYYDIEIGCYLREWNLDSKHSKLRLLFIEGDRFHNVISPGNGSVWVRYVHQLQNLFFALTGRELERQ